MTLSIWKFCVFSNLKVYKEKSNWYFSMPKLSLCLQESTLRKTLKFLSTVVE